MKARKKIKKKKNPKSSREYGRKIIRRKRIHIQKRI
jgi:hypothetical protein